MALLHFNSFHLFISLAWPIDHSVRFFILLVWPVDHSVPFSSLPRGPLTTRSSDLLGAETAALIMSLLLFFGPGCAPRARLDNHAHSCAVLAFVEVDRLDTVPPKLLLRREVPGEKTAHWLCRLNLSPSLNLDSICEHFSCIVLRYNSSVYAHGGWAAWLVRLDLRLRHVAEFTALARTDAGARKPKRSRPDLAGIKPFLSAALPSQAAGRLPSGCQDAFLSCSDTWRAGEAGSPGSDIRGHPP